MEDVTADGTQTEGPRGADLLHRAAGGGAESVPSTTGSDAETVRGLPHLLVVTATLTCGELLRRLREKTFTFDLNGCPLEVPQYTPQDLSQAVERLLLRVPVESFFVDETESTSEKASWKLVAKPDAGIRLTLTALEVFCGGTLALEWLKFLPQLNGTTWETLPPRLQNRIEDQAVQVHLIQPGIRPRDLVAVKELILAG